MRNAIFLLFLILFIKGYSQKEINSTKRTGQISLDGYLEETDWVNAKWTSGFTQMKPFPGEKASKKTEVAMLFDQEAIYFGVKCYDHPDSVSRVLSLRDDFNPNLDFFGIFLDTYNDKQMGFSSG
jgi:hypothetical protein